MAGAVSVPKKTKLGVEGVITNTYGEQTVASAATGSVVSYTVPTGKKFFLTEVAFSGRNIASYEVLRDTTRIDLWHVWFGGDLHGEKFFDGLEFSAGEKVELKVENFRPDPALFSGRIIGALADE